MTTADLRLGDWRTALADVEICDAVIVDAPYSARTHKGSDALPEHLAAIGYGWMSPDDVGSFVESWAPRCRGWVVTITDHELAPSWARALEDAGRYVFAPLPFVSPGSRVRLAGDGPSSWTCWIIVARPRTLPWSAWGTLPGGYVGPPERGGEIVGGKPLWLMRALVRDYTRHGELIVDPCAGRGTTLLAASIEGRRAVGAEIDPKTHAKARRRLERGYTPDLFGS